MRSFWSTNTNTSVPKGGSTVYVGLSGGVDSAVCAALLKQSGYEVVGSFIRISIDGYPCTAGEDKLSAQRVAAHLKIPFVEVDLSREYKQTIFDASLREFAAGRTPNPDALCNREIKFGLFFDWCMKQGAAYVATGHYAQQKDGLLYAGADHDKDQSYFLWAVPRKKLQKTLFPIGHLHKRQVRDLAVKFGLPNAARPDSQGLCFLGPVSIQDMLKRELKPSEGDVLDESGVVVGRHGGSVLYTLGQRHGFAMTARSPHTAVHFVVAKDVAANTVVVSEHKFPQTAQHTKVILADANWIGGVDDGPCLARYRYRQTLIPAEYLDGKIILNEPHYVPEGQSLVLYRGQRCLGGGVIEKAVIY